jgi:hypothetical protein
MPHVSRKNCQLVAACGRRNRNISKPGRCTSAACQIQQRSGNPSGREVEDKTATCVKMQKGLKPRRQVGGLAPGALSTRLCYSIFDFRNRNGRDVETARMLVHPLDEVGRRDAPSRRAGRNHVGIYEVHDRIRTLFGASAYDFGAAGPSVQWAPTSGAGRTRERESDVPIPRILLRRPRVCRVA